MPPAYTFSPSPPLTPGGACPPLPLITDKESDHYHLDHLLHLIVTLIRLATDSAFVQTWAKEAIWSWKGVSTSFPSSPPTAHSCLPSSGLRRSRGFRSIHNLFCSYVVFLYPDTNLCGEKVEVRKVESFKLR